jgi:succinyl-diaminopimelate desuccinylase
MSERSCIRHLRDYVAIPSVNPTERADVPVAIAGERRYAEHVADQLRRIGLDAELIGAHERVSVVAEARAARAADTLLVASHLDTVPVDGMEIDPFDPVVEGGRLYGRGACDTKGGMAALMDALERVLARGTLRRNLVIVGEADEEWSSAGVRDVLRHLGGRRPDWVLATEPTGLRVATRHKGIAVARVEARGRACHASDPSRGRNAIVALARAVQALDALAGELGKRRDPRLGAATLSVGRIGGGQAANVVPEAAWLVAERRMLPGEDVDRVRAELEAALAGPGMGDVALTSCRIMKHALATGDDEAAVLACQSVLASMDRSGEPIAVAFSTDAGEFAASGIPGVVMGPGSIEEAHTARESVPLAEVEAMADFFVGLLEAGTPQRERPPRGRFRDLGRR